MNEIRSKREETKNMSFVQDDKREYEFETCIATLANNACIVVQFRKSLNCSKKYCDICS